MRITVFVALSFAAAFASAAGEPSSPIKAGGKVGEVVVLEGVKVFPDLVYREGHERWKLDLAMPVQRGEEPSPAIVFVHGGGWRSGDKRRANFLGPAVEFAAKGYVCISVNYRLLGPGQATDIDACVEDVKCSVRWLRAHAQQYHVDPDRFGAYGNSAGAHLVAMLGLCPPSAGLEGDGPWRDHSSMLQAVVCSATPASFIMAMNDRRRHSPPRDNAAPSNAARGDEAPRRRFPQRSDELKRKISPLTYVSAGAPPFLIIHDVSDRTVSIRQGDALHQALQDVTKQRGHAHDSRGFGPWEEF